MSPTEYIYANTYGSWLLVRGKPEGAVYLDWTVSGFWKSFWVIVVCLPLLLVEWVLISDGAALVGPGDGKLMLVTIAYLLQWVAYPVILYFLARPLHMQTSFIPYIVTYNWFGVLVMLIQAPVMILTMLNVLPSLTMLLFLITIIAIIFGLIRLAMQIAGLPLIAAVGVVIMDILLGLFIDRIVL